MELSQVEPDGRATMSPLAKGVLFAVLGAACVLTFFPFFTALSASSESAPEWAYALNAMLDCFLGVYSVTLISRALRAWNASHGSKGLVPALLTLVISIWVFFVGALSIFTLIF